VVGDLQGDVTRGLPRVSDYPRLATSTTLVDGHHEVTVTIPPA
jgi:hypothetical protein